jgi:hypothetical protein
MPQLTVFFLGPTPVCQVPFLFQKEVRRILGLKEDANEFRVVYGSVPTSDNEIALLTRSMIEILTDISSTVEVPGEDVLESRVIPTMEPEGEGIRENMIAIHSMFSVEAVLLAHLFVPGCPADRPPRKKYGSLCASGLWHGKKRPCFFQVYQL